jgi:N-acyl-D-amino-acid deacylase
MKADIVILDPEKVNDPATFLDPHRYAEGIGAVVLNGIPVVEEGRFIGTLNGRVLLKNKW